MARSSAAKRMEVDERRLKDEAHALVCRGKLGAAMELYGRLLKAQPRDAVLRLRHAELSRKLGRLDDAVESYLMAGRILERDGHLTRARAAVTCALQLAPGEPIVMAPLRRLNDKLRAAPSKVPPAHLMAVPPPPVEEPRRLTPRDHLVTIPNHPPLHLAEREEEVFEKTEPFIPVFELATVH